MITVEISQAEYCYAAFAGIIRTQQNMFIGRQPAHGLTSDYVGDGYDQSILGAVGEFAASIALGVSWRGPGLFRGEDISGFEVRATGRKNGCLILHRSDADAARFVLVCGGPLVWNVCGWIYGLSGKREDFWRADSKRPAYFVPQSELIDDFSLLKYEGRSKC